MREDQVLPHLAAIAILLAGPAGKPGCGSRRPVLLTGPAGTAALIDRLRADGLVLAYDPDDRTLRAGDAPSVVIGKTAASTHPRRYKSGRWNEKTPDIPSAEANYLHTARRKPGRRAEFQLRRPGFSFARRQSFGFLPGSDTRHAQYPRPTDQPPYM